MDLNPAYREHVPARKGKPTLREYRRSNLPYGMWILSDGTVVLFNRDYYPIWKLVSGRWVDADGREWIKNIANKLWFYRDRDTKSEKQLVNRLELLLQRFRCEALPVSYN